MEREIKFHFKRLKRSGTTLAVVAIGSEVYGAASADPFVALHAAAHKASQDLATSRDPIDSSVIVNSGRAEFMAPSSAVEPRSCELWLLPLI